MKKVLIVIFLNLLIFTSYSQIASDMLEDCLASVVTVGVYKTRIVKQPLGFRGESAPDIAYEKALDMADVSGAGSGFIIKKNNKLYVVTNAHVIENASNEHGSIYVYTLNRKKYEVSLIGGDSFYDIAVLEFIDNPGTEIKSIEFRKDEVRIGEKVYAIGNPLGEYPYTVTDGIISAKNRVRGGMTGKFGFLQTTATIIWGNSGGPLVDEKGKVVGINSQIAFAQAPNGEQIIQSQINFALEASISNRLINDIITIDGRVRRAYIGIELSQSFQYERISSGDFRMIEIDHLPIISGVVPNSPASNTLLNKLNWHIIKINGKEIRSLEEALGELENIKPYETINLSIEFNGHLENISIKSTELKTQELENIARYVLNQNKNIEVDYNNPQLAFKMRNSDFYKFGENEISKYKMQNNNGSNYFILAGGIYAENTKSMWLVENLRDMGAALRLTGLSGIVDFYVLRSGNTIEDIELLRQYLSGNREVTKTTLWY